MGVTSWQPLTYQNHCTAAPALLLRNTPLYESTLLYLLLESQSTQLHHLKEHMPPQQTTPQKTGSPWWQRLPIYSTEAWWMIATMSRNTPPMGEEAVAGTDITPSQKAEDSAPPLDTSSQASVERWRLPWRVKPINVCSPMATGSNHSDSPMIDLTQLQVNANLAANHMLSIKRSLDLERQWAIQDFEASMHQQEAKESCSQWEGQDCPFQERLNAKVKCAKAVMKAKYDYRLAIQEARTIRCSEPQESETAYSEALGENAAMRSTQCTTLHREHVRHMHELEDWPWMQETRATKAFFLHVKPSYAMLWSLSKRISIPLTISY